MNQRSMKMGNKMYDIVTPSQFMQCSSLYNLEYTALLIDNIIDVAGNIAPPCVLPFRTISDYRRGVPGVYNLSEDPSIGYSQPYYYVIYPYTYDEYGRITGVSPIYSTATMLDAGNADSMQKLVELNNEYRAAEYNIMTSGNNVTTFRIDPANSEALKAFKQALNSKRINFDKYKVRIGQTYANDKRCLEHSDTITLQKIISLCEATDIAVTIIFDNVSPDVPNPMPNPIVQVLTGGIEGLYQTSQHTAEDWQEPAEESEIDDEYYGEDE